MKFHTEKWPIVYFKVNMNNITDEIFEEYKKNYLSLLLRSKREGVKIVLICDLFHCFNYNTIETKYIMKQSEFNTETYKFNKEYLKCICILCKSSVLKNMLNLYFGMSKPAAPYKICKNFQKANEYLIQKYDLHDIHVEKLCDWTDNNDEEEEEEEKEEEE